MLSIRQSYGLARFLGWVLYHVDKRHREVGLDNLAIAYEGRLSDHKHDQIVRGVYRHFCMMLMEILHTPQGFLVQLARPPGLGRPRPDHGPVVDR